MDGSKSETFNLLSNSEASTLNHSICLTPQVWNESKTAKPCVDCPFPQTSKQIRNWSRSVLPFLALLWAGAAVGFYTRNSQYPRFPDEFRTCTSLHMHIIASQCKRFHGEVVINKWGFGYYEYMYKDIHIYSYICIYRYTHIHQNTSPLLRCFLLLFDCRYYYYSFYSCLDPIALTWSFYF